MATFLLTWNPALGSGKDLERLAAKSRNGQRIKGRWSTGKRRQIHKGDRLFLLRQGVEPRGIIASGVATSEVRQDEHWIDAGRTTNYVKVTFDTVLKPDQGLPRAQLDEPQFTGVHWSTQQGGIRINEPMAGRLEKAWKQHVATLFYPDLDRAKPTPPGMSVLEGKKAWNIHLRLERNQAIVAQKKAEARGKLECECCGFDFGKQYGSLGEGYIECHHKTPLHSLSGKIRTTLTDLVLVCANCHRMLHRSANLKTLEELKAALAHL